MYENMFNTFNNQNKTTVADGAIYMETFSALIALCEGNIPLTHGFPSHTQHWCFIYC